MPAPPRDVFQYAVIRVVPRVERGEQLNVGVILLSRGKRYLGAQDRARRGACRRRSPRTSTWPRSARTSTRSSGSPRATPSAGPIARLEPAERFHWLVSPSSTIIQASEVHTGLSDDPARELDELVEKLVR